MGNHTEFDRKFVKRITAIWLLMLVCAVVTAVASVANVRRSLPLEERVKILEDARVDQQKRNDAQDALNEMYIDHAKHH